MLEAPPPGLSLPIVVDGALYLRSDGSRHVLAGLHSEELDEPADPDAFRETSDADFEQAVAQLLTERLVNAGDLTLRGGWAGLYPLTPDGSPVLGEAVAVPGFHHLAGLGGNGIQLSGGLGRVAADLVADGSSPLLPDAARYSLERFDSPV